MKQETIWRMNDTELEALVHKHFPEFKNWNFAADQEAGNDSTHSFKVNGEGDIPTIRHDFQAQALLDRLCLKREIPAGNYVIDVSW